MGTVYRAEQSHPVRRQVALKLIKLGMDSRTVLARFDAERQALALMDHPNIARVYDGGATDTNQPFFVMELVDGVPITDYCDQHRLSVAARLQLFVAVCQAVQHAHQKGIIHRDIKPSNVLVTEVNGRPTPKVIDFGVAKATESNLTDRTLGDTGAIVGTPTYMSPEQADPSSMDIDTRTDVYALGVILYELLAGSPPLDVTQFKRGALLEMLRMVREVNPSKPSTKVSTADALPSIAANRGIDPDHLKRALRGDLDWIVMKALEKDRTRRYETANGLGADILRHLASEPVLAAPPSRSYRARKFVRKHRAGVVAASLVLLALVAGVMGTTLGLIEARRQEGLARDAERLAHDERDRALKAEAHTREERDRVLKAEAHTREERDRAVKAESLAREERDRAVKAESLAREERDRAVKAEALARTEADKSKAINEFLTTDLLTQAEPANNAAEDRVTLLEVLDRAADKVGERFRSRPEVEVALRGSIASTYHGLGSWDKAERQYRALIELARRPGARPEESYRAEGELAHILVHMGRMDDEVAAMARSATEGLKRILGPDNPETLTSMGSLAINYFVLGRHAEALKLREETVALSKDKLGTDHQITLAEMGNLANSYSALGRHAEALKLSEEVLALRKAKLGPDHPNTLTGMNDLASRYDALGRHAKAIKLHEETLALSKARLGTDHPLTLTSMKNLALSYAALGRHAEALKLYEEALALRKAKLGPDHPDTLESMKNLAGSYSALGRHFEALELREETVALMKAKLGLDHPNTLAEMGNLAGSYSALGLHAEALNLREETLALRKAWLGPDHPDTLSSMNNLAGSYSALGRDAEALKLREEMLALRKAKLGPDHPLTLTSMKNLALSYSALGRHAEALKLREEMLALGKAKLGPDHPFTLVSMNDLANSYDAVGRHAEALKLHEETLALMKAKLGPHHRNTLVSMNNLAFSYAALGRHAEALKLREETLALRKARLGPDHPDTLLSMNNLAGSYLASGRAREALALLAECSAAEPKNALLALRVAALQAWFGQEKELAETRKRALANAEGTGVAITAERTVKACSILPSADRAEIEAAVALARRALDLGKGSKSRFHFLLALGMAEYRAGHDVAAEEALLAAPKAAPNNPHVTGISAFYRAMSLFRRGKKDEARTLATEAAAKMRPLPKDEQDPLVGGAYHDDLILWLAYKEAKALIGFDAPAATPGLDAK